MPFHDFPISFDEDYAKNNIKYFDEALVGEPGKFNFLCVSRMLVGIAWSFGNSMFWESGGLKYRRKVIDGLFGEDHPQKRRL